MAKQTINIGTVANDGTGDSVRAGGDKINDNFTEVYTALGDGTNLNDVVTNTTFQNTLANTNAHITAVETREAVHTANALSQLANTNAYIGAVEINDSFEKVLEVFIKEAHSRVPVYEKNSTQYPSLPLN